MSVSCWASSIGGCCDQATEEHPAGHHGGLLTNVRILGFHAELEDKVVPIDALHGKVLCEEHNNQFGREIDHVAHDAYRAIRSWFFEPNGQETESGLWIPTVREIPGPAFLRWLCKFSCNMLAMKGQTPYPPYVHCALGIKSLAGPQVYLRTDHFEFRRRIRYQDYRFQWPGDDEKHLAFRVLFMGFEFLVTPRPLANLSQSLVEIDPGTVGQWTERPPRLARRCDEVDVEGNVLRIHWP